MLSNFFFTLLLQRCHIYSCIVKSIEGFIVVSPFENFSPYNERIHGRRGETGEFYTKIRRFSAKTTGFIRFLKFVFKAFCS